MSDTLTSTPMAPPVPSGPGEPKQEANASLWADAFRDLRRRPTVIGSTLFLLIIASMAIFPTLWTSQDPKACNVTRSVNVAGSQPEGSFNLFGSGSYVSAEHP